MSDINMNEIDEQLDILEETKAQIKQAIIDKGQSVSDEDSFRSYATKIENISTQEDLDSVITAQENKLEALETLLESKVSGNSKPNIFVQENEPSKKDGIWLKMNNKTAEHYISDDNIFIGGEWLPNGTKTNIPYNFYSSSAVTIGTDIYLIGGMGTGSNSYKCMLKYDTLTDTYTQLTDMPIKILGDTATTIGTDIYLLGGNSSKSNYDEHYKYDTLTDTYTQLTNSPYGLYGSAIAIGTNIYLFGLTANYSTYYAYKYDTLTDTYTKLTDLPSSVKADGTVYTVIGTDIYLLGSQNSTNNNYKYDTLTDTYTKLTDIPYEFKYGSATAMGTDIYLLGGSTSKRNAYKYNTLTDTYTQLEDIPDNVYSSSAVTIGTDIYLIGGQDDNKMRVYKCQSKTYEQDNLVVVFPGKSYNVELFSNDLFIKPALYGFADVWFYTLQGGLDGTMPVYYGNGTQWVNIKNPPTEGGNE